LGVGFGIRIRMTITTKRGKERKGRIGARIKITNTMKRGKERKRCRGYEGVKEGRFPGGAKFIAIFHFEFIWVLLDLKSFLDDLRLIKRDTS